MWKLFERKKREREKQLMRELDIIRSAHDKEAEEIKRRAFCTNCAYAIRTGNYIVCSLRDRATCPDFRRKEE